MKAVFRGSVQSNKLTMGDDYITKLFTLEGKDIDLTIEVHRNQRSQNQSRYYFGVVVKLLSKETGYSLDETHEILRGKFLQEGVKIGDSLIQYARSTTSLTTSEFEEYLTEIREWSSVELNCYIPLPNEVEF